MAVVHTDPWWRRRLLLSALLIHAATGVIRPMISYRALEIGMPASSLGLIAACFAIGPLVIAIPAGRAADSWGERWVTLGGGLLLTLAAGALAFSDTAAAIIVLSFVMGAGHLLTMVGIQGALARGSEVADYDAAFGYLALAASVGQLLGPLAAGAVAADGSPAGITNALLLGAATAGAGTIATLTWIGRTRPRSRSTDTRRAGGSARSVLGTPGILPAIVASMTVLSAIDIISVYLPALGAELGIPVAVVGVLLAVRAGASTLSRIGLGRLSARVGRERLLFTSMIASALSVAVLPFMPGSLAIGICLVVAGFALGIGQPLTMSWVAARAEPGSRSTALSIRLMGNRIGQVIVPVVAGAVAGPLGVAGVFLATGAVVAGSAAFVESAAGRDTREARSD